MEIYNKLPNELKNIVDRYSHEIDYSNVMNSLVKSTNFSVCINCNKPSALTLVYCVNSKNGCECIDCFRKNKWIIKCNLILKEINFNCNQMIYILTVKTRLDEMLFYLKITTINCEYQYFLKHGVSYNEHECYFTYIFTKKISKKNKGYFKKGFIMENM